MLTATVMWTVPGDSSGGGGLFLSDFPEFLRMAWVAVSLP